MWPLLLGFSASAACLDLLCLRLGVVCRAGALPVKHVIHTVGPVYDSEDDPASLLASAYQ